MDFKTPSVLLDECREGVQWGFTGKQAIHPSQVEVIQKAFSPSDKDVAYAMRVVEGYSNSATSGKGAFELDGKMIDMVSKVWI